MSTLLLWMRLRPGQILWMTNSFTVFCWGCWWITYGCRKGASTCHACSSWFYSGQASSLPLPCSGSVFQVLKMGTYRLGVPCPTSKATVWSWSCWTVVPSASVYNEFFCISLFYVFLFLLVYLLSSLTLGGPALCLNFGPSLEHRVNEGVVPLLLDCFHVFIYKSSPFSL